MEHIYIFLKRHSLLFFSQCEICFLLAADGKPCKAWRTRPFGKQKLLQRQFQRDSGLAGSQDFFQFDKAPVSTVKESS